MLDEWSIQREEFFKILFGLGRLNSPESSALAMAQRPLSIVPPQYLIHTNSLVFRSLGDSLRSRRFRQAERCRMLQTNPEPALRCCWNRSRCAIKLPYWSAAEPVARVFGVLIGRFGSFCRSGGRNGAKAW
jgi:hypothetical protein